MRASTALMASTICNPVRVSMPPMRALTAITSLSPQASVMMFNTLSTSGWAATKASISARSCGAADSPTIRPLTSIMTAIAITISTMPIANVPSASHNGLPVTTLAATARKASARPSKAAMSSPATTISSDWRVSRNQRRKGWRPDILRISCSAPHSERDSSTTAPASTAMAITPCCSGCGCSRRPIPSYTENAPPMKNSSSATIIDQK